ncbi:heparan-alpha-glucosaminide N-acetyltransferase domain-containing protein [Fulvivirga ligni]|uniref:heparan-alpha-glucosaminide N-acetyltransferase domain-containing protein n=1 Tax=Fulvivirga ligni TaxID=2904246 RepID=UPI001F3CCFDA|nr:heparan-alpha-glucosaminide N-acetyltransferase domain-containing protein [Fulvivirga ligni]UII19031.1 DUF1624 domain-containing protein [Fulvivirga ligni]
MEALQNKRILAIDFGRGMSVLVMILVHTLWVYGSIETQRDSSLGHVIHFIGKGTAMFLVSMGVSFVLSSRQSVAGSMQRGLVILGVGYLMNVLKFIVPLELFHTMPEGFLQDYGWARPLSLDKLIWLATIGDILQLAGVALFFMGCANRYVKNKYILLVIALFIALPSRFLSGVSTDIPVLHYLCELFFSDAWHVYFPVFPWMSFMFAGMFLGRYYKEMQNDQDLLFKKMLQYGLIFLVVGGALCYYNFTYHFGDFFHLGPGGAFYLLGLNLIVLWVIHVLLKYMGDNYFVYLVYYCSRNVTSLYVIQWTLVFWGTMIFGYKDKSSLQIAFIMPIMILATLSVNFILGWIRNK